MTDAKWLNAVEDEAWRGLRRVNLLTLAGITRDLQTDCGLSDSDYDVLSALSESPHDKFRFRELATQIRWSTSRLSHHLARMQQRGLIERHPSEDDARGSDITLTELGRATIEEAAPHHVRSVRRHLFNRLSERQTAQLAEIVNAIAQTDR